MIGKKDDRIFVLITHEILDFKSVKVHHRFFTFFG